MMQDNRTTSRRGEVSHAYSIWKPNTCSTTQDCSKRNGNAPSIERRIKEKCRVKGGRCLTHLQDDYLGRIRLRLRRVSHLDLTLRRVSYHDLNLRCVSYLELSLRRVSHLDQTHSHAVAYLHADRSLARARGLHHESVGEGHPGRHTFAGCGRRGGGLHGGRRGDGLDGGRRGDHARNRASFHVASCLLL